MKELTIDKARGFFLRSKVWHNDEGYLAVILRRREPKDQYTCAVYDPRYERVVAASRSYFHADQQVKDLMADKDMLVLK